MHVLVSSFAALAILKLIMTLPINRHIDEFMLA